MCIRDRIVMVLPVALPDFFLNGVEGLSIANTPVGMMLIGMMLAEMDPRGLVDRTMVWYAAVRLVPVSYTHLDVYKRQGGIRTGGSSRV